MNGTARVRSVVTALLIVSLALQSCTVIRSIFGGSEDSNSPPSVGLYADEYYPYSDENVTFTADAYDSDGDYLSYDWYVNGSYYTSTSGGDTELTLYWLTASYQYPNVYVSVSDGNGGNATSSTVYVYVYPGASLRVYNYSSYPIWYVHYRNYYDTSGWDSYNYPTIPYGYFWKLTGIAGGYYYDLYVENSYGVYAETDDSYPDGMLLPDGYYRNFLFYDASWTLEAGSNYSLAARTKAALGAAEAETAPRTEISTSINAIGSVDPNESLPDRDEAMPLRVYR